MAGNADELRHNVREAFRRGASFLKLCVTGGVVGAHDRLTDTQFAVVERLLYDTAGAGLAESTCDRVKGSREQMTEALAVAEHAGGWIGVGSDLNGPVQDRRGRQLSLRAALETDGSSPRRRRGPTPRSPGCPAT
ncbi:hypothetical protein ACFXOY_18890 [Streptomyces niveus]|uniref:hypothetical protein n=1 Tax=Streptomyces niveus TaxID=193462 RepID=UPI0036C36EA8